MPTIIPQRPAGQVSASTEAAYVAPLKKLQAASTGMVIPESKEPVKEAENGQPAIKEETTPQAATVTLSPQLTALARKEQKLRQELQAFKAEKTAFEATQAKYAKYETLEGKLASKDFSALEELGISYDEYTNYLLNKGEAEKPEVQAIKKLEDEVKSLRTQQEETVSKQYEATINKYRKDIKEMVEKDPAYESVKELKAEEHVMQLIIDTFKEENELLSIEEAAKEVEEYLLEEALQMAKLKKVQEKLAPPKQTLPPPKQGSKTLTNQTVATGPTKSYQQFQHLSPKERLAQALAKAQANKG